MNTHTELLTAEFRALSARLGQDPLQVQGPGGNTSIKDGEVMWIKASGTELADAERQEIFVPVDRAAALAEARGEAGDGSCKGTVIDPAIKLRPSIETTFHAALDFAVAAHTHSVATLVHAISDQGLAELAEKLEGVPYALVPYAKPGLPLTREILAKASPETQVFILQNHGLLAAGGSVAEVADLIADVEQRLKMPFVHDREEASNGSPDAGFGWSDHAWLAHNGLALTRATSGTYYPDHVVFLGPALPTADHAGKPPAILKPSEGVQLRDGATSSQKAMLQCISDVLARVPAEWTLNPIGEAAEAELLDWDAEKYRQALAARA